MTARSARLATAPSLGRLARAGIVVAVAATAATVLVGIVLRAIVNPDPAFQPLTAPAIAIITIVYTAIATLVYAVIARRSEQPRRRWIQVAIAALVLSLLPNLGLIANPSGAPFAGVTTEAVLALVVLHLVAAPIVVLGLLRLAPVQDR